jgi:hypothetical protein
VRSTAELSEEIRARHGCIWHGGVMGDVPDLAPYDAIAISSLSDVSIAASLSDALPKVRVAYEVSEIYVRPRGDGTLYEPLAPGHFALEGEWVMVARRRHPTSEPRVVGIMLAKDEADAIPDVVARLSTSLDALYYFAGDAATAAAIVASAPDPSWARAVPDPGTPHADGLRHFLLERAREDALVDGDSRPMWVMVVQGDEVYHDDLRLHIRLAQAERATVMTCQVATFLIHESQRENWDWAQPLDKRLTHYIWDFGEHAGFLDFPWIYYAPSEHMRAHPHGIYPDKWASARPVRKHYPFRTPEQARARIEDRLRGSAAHPHGWQPHYENYRDVFVGDRAAGREVKRYHGWFGEAERVTGIW